jgi:phosphoglycolate phosphatase/pyrophosphatase PpaX
VDDAPHQRRYDAAIFDLDGTIADTLPLIYVAFNAALEPVLGRTLEPSEIRAMFGPPDHEILRKVVPPEGAESAIARYLQSYERDHTQLVTVFEGLAALLEDAHQQGIRLGVVTGKSRVTALFTLEQLGIAQCFDAIYAGDDVARHKPDPEAIEAALDKMGVADRERAVMIGDSAADMLAGRAAGIATIGVLWGSPDHQELAAAEPDRLCGNVAELRAALGLTSITSVEAEV